MSPWGLIGRIYIGDHLILLQTKSTSCGAYMASVKIYKVFMSMRNLLEFQSNQPKNLMQPFPYLVCDHSLRSGFFLARFDD